jgi:two-component system, cell cycle sensor histidine kinase and response regulator CckA
MALETLHTGKPRRSIARTLSGFFFSFGLITLLASWSLQLVGNFQTQRKAVFERQVLVARGAADSVKGYLEQNYRVLESVTWFSDLPSQTPSRQHSNLQGLLGFQPSFKQLVFLEPDGRVAAQVSRLSQENSARFTGQFGPRLVSRFRQQARYISDVYVDQMTSEPLVIMAVQVKDLAGGLRGILVAEVNLKFMWDLVDQLKVGETGRTYVVDHRGNLIAFGDTARVLRGENLGYLPPVAEFTRSRPVAGAARAQVYRGIMQVRAVGTYVALGTPDWAVLTEVSLMEALDPVLRASLVSLVIVLALALLAGLSGIRLARRLAVPLVNLTETAGRIASGERELQAATDGPAEVYCLGVAFNSMTAQLEQSLFELEQQVQEVNRAQEQLYVTQFAVDKSADAVFLLDPQARFLSVNEAACRSLGYTREELVTMTVFDVDAALPRDQWPEICAKLEREPSLMIESYHRAKDGRVFPVELTSNLVQYGGKVYYCAFVRDVTARKKEEQSLLRTQFSVDRAKDAIFWIAPDGKLVYVNAAACQTLGYQESELLGMTVFDIDPRFPRERWAEHWKKSHRLGSYIIETTHRAKDGRFVPVEVAIDFFSFSGEDYHCAYARDISERKKAAEEQQTLVSLVEMSRDFICIADLKGRVTYLNNAALEMVGLADQEEARGKLIFDFFPEEALAQAREAMYPALLQGGYWRAESVFRHMRTGASIDVDLCAFSIRDAHGEPLCLATVTRDISERKSAQEHQVRLEEQLQHAQKLESVGRLAGGVAHDFNNMLSVIIGYAEMIRMRLDPENPLMRDVAQIERAAGRSKQITQQLLAFSRKQIIQPTVVNLNDLVTGTQLTLARLIGEDIELRFLPEPELWGANLDPSQVDQILVNLVVNARDAMPGGGKLTIETANLTLDQEFCRDHAEYQQGSYVCLMVSDSGVGMDKETVSHVFEPFFTTKELDKGTGLGLSTVYGIVKQNGGFISIYSEPGEGTLFRICFPRSLEAPASAEAPTPAPVPQGSDTILLVEDDELVRGATLGMLELMGYRVLVAESPHEALELCQDDQIHIDLLITDVVMPGMKGTELRERLEAFRPGLRTLYMSGYTTSMIVHHGVLDEGVHFLNKPFTMSELSLSVRRAFE